MPPPLKVPKAIVFSSASKEAAPRRPGRKKSHDFDLDFEAMQNGTKKMSESSLSAEFMKMNRRESNESTITASVGDFDRYSQLSMDLIPDTCSRRISETDARHSSFAPDCSFRLATGGAEDESCSTFAPGYSTAKIDIKKEYGDHDRKGLSAYRSEAPLHEEPHGGSVSTFDPDYSNTDLVFGEKRRSLLVGVGGSAKFGRDQQSFLDEDPPGR